MIHSFVSSSIVVGEVYDNYNIQSSTWEGKAPMWIYHALGKIGINRFTVDRDPILIDFTENRFQIPYDATLIKKLHFFEDEPDEKDYDKSIIPGEIKIPFSQRGLWIHTLELEEGYVLVKYKSLPAENNTILKQTFPLIPNDEILLEALRVYLLMQILMTGYVHPIYNLSVNNPWTNPQFMFKDLVKLAKISVGRMDPLDRHKVSKQINTFISAQLSTTFYLNDINR